MPKYPDAIVSVDRLGESGNAYIIMGSAIRVMKGTGASTEDLNAYKTAAMSGDYENLIAVTKEYVTVMEPRR